MTTLEKRVIRNRKTIQRLMPELKPVMFKPMGKLSGAPKGAHNKSFDQWQQGFNQYGK
ncbi:MAG: hypothetical protein JWM68_2064 [Verrucomicrobiales bacterium]|nr:hypothetical protein [Verrucomicrobiales bacterium]